MREPTDVQVGIIRDTMSEGGGYVYCAIPRCDTVQSGRLLPVFWRDTLPPCSM